MKIDTHAHWYPPEWVDLLAREGAANGAEVGRTGQGRVTLLAPGIRLRPTFSAPYVDLKLRLNLMDEARVDMHALSLTSPMVSGSGSFPAVSVRVSSVEMRLGC